MNSPTFSERIRYKFDRLMTSGTVAMISALALLVFSLVVFVALIIQIADIRPADATQPIGFIEAAWSSLMRTLDPGTMGDDSGWSYRLMMFLVTITGVFIFSTLIGVVSSGIEEKLRELRKGRSRVIERDHTVILGWSSQIFAIINELIIANQNRKNACIVIMGMKDKVEMEDEIHTHVDLDQHTRIVCRRGNPIDQTDLKIVNIAESRSVIILSPEKQNPDADVIKTLLAIVHGTVRNQKPLHLVAELRDPKNKEVASMVGKHEVELILVNDLISRIVAQTCQQSGLSVVYQELLDFSGDEIYFKLEPSLVSIPFGEVLSAYEDSSVIGIQFATGGSKINPPMDTILAEGDQIIAISEDDDTIQRSSKSDLQIHTEFFQTDSHFEDSPESILMLGWNCRASTIINELDSYVMPGSRLQVVSQFEIDPQFIQDSQQALKNIELNFQMKNTAQRQTLEQLKLERFNSIIVLAYSDHFSLQEADAITLVSLLHLRDLADQYNYPFAIVSEMLDINNRKLAEITHADDFIVSDEVASLLLTQVSENKNLNSIFEDIFDPSGSEIYLKPAEDYIKLGQPVNFYTIVESARRKQQIAIGYRIYAQQENPEVSYGVVINPDKSTQITFSDGDRLIVFSED